MNIDGANGGFDPIAQTMRAHLGWQDMGIVADARIASLLEGTTDEFVAFDQGWGYADANQGGLRAIAHGVGPARNRAGDTVPRTMNIPDRSPRGSDRRRRESAPRP